MINQIYPSIYLGDSSVQRIYQGDDLIYLYGTPDILLEYIANGPDDNSGAKSVYYDTGVATKTTASDSSSGTKMEIKVAAYNESSQTWAAGEVNTTSWNGFVFYMSYPSSGSYIYARIGGQNVTIGSAETNPYTSNQIVTMSAFLDTSEKNQYNQYRPKLVYNGVTYSGTGYTGGTGTGQNIYLFTRNRSSGTIAGSPSGLKMYYAKIWEDNNLIRFYIPVLHYTNGQYTPCFYDKVNDSYIYNLGTDTPTYKISGDYLLDWLGSEPETSIPDSSAFYLMYDTGVVASNQLQVDTKSRVVYGREQYIFGSGTSAQTTPTWQPYGYGTPGGTGESTLLRLRVGFGATSTTNYTTYLAAGDSSTVNAVNTLSMWCNSERGLMCLNGTMYNTQSPVPDTFPSTTIHLLARHGNSTVTQISKGARIYYINFTTSNVPTKTIIPVLHNGKPEFLDLQAGTYLPIYGNTSPYGVLKN